jgi:L-asparaginase
MTSDELSAEIPGLELVATVTHEQFSNVPSAGLTLGHWLDLSKRINQLLSSDRALQGIVVTSGTDTLEETAFFLHLTVRDDRPVVVVGAMRRPHWVGYEGPANLLEAVRVAAFPASRGRGVLVVMNDEINSARDVVKTDANRLQTFRSGNHGLLGVVDRDRIVFLRDVSQRHTGRSEFDISGLKELPSVEIIFVYQGASGHLIRAAVDGGAKAIVFAGAGAGALAITQVGAVDYALDKGVILIRGSRTGSGRVFRSEPSADATPAQLRRRAAMIPAEDHAPVKARILAMLALTKTSNREEIERIFLEY